MMLARTGSPVSKLMVRLPLTQRETACMRVCVCVLGGGCGCGCGCGWVWVGGWVGGWVGVGVGPPR